MDHLVKPCLVVVSGVLHVMRETLFGALDTASVGVVISVLLGWMPSLAAVLTVLWLGARFYNEVMTAVYRHRGHRSVRRRTDD